MVSLTVSALRLARRVTDALGADIGTDLAPLLSGTRPPKLVTTGLRVRRDEFEGIPAITMLPNEPNSPNVIVAIPGGAYVVRPTIMHWALYSLVARRTRATVVVSPFTRWRQKVAPPARWSRRSPT
jgi:triacylglycerol lipase